MRACDEIHVFKEGSGPPHWWRGNTIYIRVVHAGYLTQNFACSESVRCKYLFAGNDNGERTI